MARARERHEAWLLADEENPRAQERQRRASEAYQCSMTGLRGTGYTEDEYRELMRGLDARNRYLSR
jgi:hypothetical protein